jgi:hypothetical protein
MKKILMLLAAAAFSTAAFAQGEKVVVREEVTGAKTETTIRDNGTVKTETRTGRTEVGEKAYNTKEDVKDAGKKTGKVVKKGAQKTGKAVMKGAKITLSRDSILKLFKTEHPFRVQQLIYDSEYYNMDFKALYYDKELKPYFLKWLDVKEYSKLILEKKSKDFTNQLSDTTFLKSEVRSYLYKQYKDNIADSIIKTPGYYVKYKSNAMLSRSEFYKEEGKNEIYYPPMNFFTFLKYPESYSIIKKWYNNDDIDSHTKNELYNALLKFNDPEALQKLDKVINEFIRTNGKSSNSLEILRIFKDTRTSHVTQKAIDALSVTDLVDYIESFPPIPPAPFNCLLLKDCIIPRLISNKILNSVPNCNDKRNDCACILLHLQQIKLNAKKLVLKLQKDEEYWMSYLPFYKNRL